MGLVCANKLPAHKNILSVKNFFIIQKFVRVNYLEFFLRPILAFTLTDNPILAV